MRAPSRRAVRQAAPSAANRARLRPHPRPFSRRFDKLSGRRGRAGHVGRRRQGAIARLKTGVFRRPMRASFASHGSSPWASGDPSGTTPALLRLVAAGDAKAIEPLMRRHIGSWRGSFAASLREVTLDVMAGHLRGLLSLRRHELQLGKIGPIPSRVARQQSCRRHAGVRSDKEIR